MVEYALRWCLAPGKVSVTMPLYETGQDGGYDPSAMQVSRSRPDGGLLPGLLARPARDQVLARRFWPGMSGRL